VRVSVGDVRLFFDVQGTKLRPHEARLEDVPTVLVLHAGPGFDHTPYKESLGPALAGVAQVVYLDQRGHGRSDRSSPARWNLDTWSSDVVEFCRNLEIERPLLVGQGWGAMIAVLVAARHPELPSRLVLAAPLARIVADRSVAMFERLGGPEPGEIAWRFYHEPTELAIADYLRVCFPLLSRRPRLPDTVLRVAWNFEVLIHWQQTEARRVDLREEAARVRVPTLAIHGDEDPQMPIIGGRELVDAIPGARLLTLPGARHALFHDEQAAIDAVVDFLRE
jgi:pimeloyl-ACP methyl ester carboxylesterase